MDKTSFNTRSQRVVVEYKSSVEWWLLTDEGDVSVFGSAEAVLKRVRKLAQKGNRGVTLTQVEWRDTPEGWRPPSA